MPLSDPIAELAATVRAAAEELGGGSTLAGTKLDRPPRPDFGDFSSNAPMLLAPTLGEPPRAVAERLGELVGERLDGSLDRVEVAGPGFLNLFLSDDWFRQALAAARAAGVAYGGGTVGTTQRVQVEFVSANPTGPLTVASGRHAAWGDALCRLLEFAGHAVEREYYVNDHGSQVLRFGESIQARARGEEPPEDGYRGGYVEELAARLPGAADADPWELARAGVEQMVAGIRGTLERFRVEFDSFFHESTLHEEGRIEQAIGLLRERGHVYERDDAVWLRTTNFGDDKDRVLRRGSGEYTYFGADIAHHLSTRERGVERVINVWGADHHGYVRRMLAMWEALGGEPGSLELLIMQLVNLLERGQRVQMSKREGEFVTLDDLIDDIGVDAARFFLLQRSHDTTLDLDLARAREQSQENPVYYVQYAHARIASILSRSPEAPPAGDPAPLHPSERDLVKQLLELPAEVAVAAERRAPHRMTEYALETARQFSAFYRDCKVIGSEEEAFRLELCSLTKQVLARSLDLLGVEAPDSM